jgi:hypothetical protein
MTSAVSSLFVSWQAPESRRIYPIARLMRLPSGEFEFAYIRAAREAERQGFAGLPGFEALAEVYLSPDLPRLFETRPVSRGRRVPLQGEFEPFQGPANDALDAAPITVFVPRAAGAPPERLEAFAPPLPGPAGTYFGVFVIRGVGRIPGSAELVEQLAASEALRLEPEPNNAYNPRALLVTRADGAPLGYAPDYLVNELSLIPNASAGLDVHLLAAHRLNFPPADPLYQVTCHYQCDDRVGRALFHSPAYEPLSPKAFRAE